MSHWLWELAFVVLVALAIGAVMASLLCCGVHLLGKLLRPPSRKRKTDLVTEQVLVSAPKWVVWGRQDSKRCTGWEPVYVGDEPNVMMTAARRDYPLTRGYDLILLENGKQPEGS